MTELQDMLRVQARLHRKQGANALGDLFENANGEIETLRTQLAACEKSLKTATDSWNFEAKKCNEAESQLVKANERVEELELIVVAITHADETGYVDDVGFVENWSQVCDETKALLNKFAIEKKIEAYKLVLNEYGRGMHPDHQNSLRSLIEQLLKEQDSE